MKRILFFGVALVMVSLVLSICGCLDNNTDNEDEKDKNKKPVADVSNTQSLGFKNDPVSFQGVGHDPDGTIVLFEWDFDGDGVYDWKSNKTGITTYEYNNPGLYHASLKVTDNDGAVDIDYIEITIEPGGLPPIHDVYFKNLENGYIINSTFNITGGAIKSHNEDEILNIKISINNSAWKDLTYWETSEMDYEWCYILNTITYQNGNYKISIKAIGKTYGEIVKTITVEIKN